MLDKILNRTVSVTMVLLVFVVLGCISIGRLPVSLIPDVDIPVITVQISAPDYSARELDDVLIKPLRSNLIQINHLKNMTAESKDGSATLTLSFEEGQGIDYLYIEVNEKIDRAMSSLPKIDRPKVLKASATDIPAFYINITLKDSVETAVSDPILFPASDKFLELSDFARDVIVKRIEQLDEVAMVDMSGYVEKELLLIPDEDKLRRIGLTIEDFEKSVSSANISLPNLTIRDGQYHYNVKFRSFAKSREDIADVYFKAGERIFQVKDVADVIEHPARRTGLATSDGKDAVVLAVIKQSQARMSDLKNSISTQIEAFRKDYPQMDFTVTRDQTELLEYSIRNLMLNIILAVVLVCVVIFLFMKDLRSPVLVALTIPASLVISFFVFHLIGMSINIISLSGLLLGVGMMVDNSIILVDNITSRWQKGEELRQAVVQGSMEVAGPMLSSVLTTCAVFLPLVFLNGLAGELFFDQAVSVTVVLLTAYVVSIVVLPVYYWAFYRKFDSFRPGKLLSRLHFGGVVRIYDKAVSACLSNRWLSWAVPVASIAVIVLCVNFMQKEKLPPITYTDTILNIDWNEHITVDENHRRISEIEEAIGRMSSQTTSYVGVQQFVLSHSGDQSINEASLYVKCRDAEELEEAKALLEAHIRNHYPSAIGEFSSSGNIFDMVFAQKEPVIEAKLRSTVDYGLLVNDVRDLTESIRRDLPDVHIDDISLKTDILYISDPKLMSLYGITFQDLTSVLKNALNGNTVFDIVQGNRSIPVVIGTDVRNMEDILAKSFIDKGNGPVPVKVLMRQSYEEDFKQMVSGDQGDYYPVDFDIPASRAQQVMRIVRNAVTENGKFDVTFSGSYFSNIELMRQMAIVLLVAVALLFLILASQFESLIQPVIILSEIIIDIAVSLLALWALGVSINIMSLIGLVVVSGIVINDSILKIDTINKLVRSGCAIDDAIHEAGHRRLKAIIMTSITTILAVAPFLSRGNMGDDLQYPMALVIIVGMSIGTLVSLFFVPTLYSTIYRHRR